MTYRVKCLLVLAFGAFGAGVGVLSVSNQGAGLVILLGAIGAVSGTAIGSAVFGLAGSRSVEIRPPVPAWDSTGLRMKDFWRERADSPVPEPPDFVSDNYMLEPDRRD